MVELPIFKGNPVLILIRFNPLLIPIYLVKVVWGEGRLFQKIKWSSNSLAARGLFKTHTKASDKDEWTNRRADC